ncbi:hypothetical protein [Demequina iriomotensis]|uniref:hypothetical protein n=1 Tax=Demequina iriomotensis TaxID=1536641 RepID=UPI000A6314CE|nr:hypothetical protein [Demequina iriomotensis]
MRRRAWAVAAGTAGVALSLAFVRLSLAWSDSQPYDPEVTEPRYVAFIVIALAITASGLVAATLIWRGRR